jgi:DNA-binding GntR family transcriptional regulator
MADEVNLGMPAVRLRRASTAEQVAVAMRELIIDGAIAPGAHLSEASVSQQLGVSRNTVREALQILVSQGLVRREIHRGAYVAELDADDVRDLFRVRRLVELAAVRESVERGADLSELERRLDAVAAAANPAAAVSAELEFWHGLVSLVHSERFGALHAAAVSELQLAAAFADGERAVPKRSVRPLRSVLSAMRRGDGERAASIAADRLDRDEIGYLALLEG